MEKGSDQQVTGLETLKDVGPTSGSHLPVTEPKTVTFFRSGDDLKSQPGLTGSETKNTYSADDVNSQPQITQMKNPTGRAKDVVSQPKVTEPLKPGSSKDAGSKPQVRETKNPTGIAENVGPQPQVAEPEKPTGSAKDAGPQVQVTEPEKPTGSAKDSGPVTSKDTGLRQRIIDRSENTGEVEDVRPVRITASAVTKHQENFHTLCVMEFAVGTPTVTTEWLLAKTQASRNEGGGELKAELVQDDPGKPARIHVGATTERLLIAAELMELKKPYEDNSLREVSLDDLDNFKNTDDLDAFLLLAEKQRIVLHELKLIRAPKDQLDIPGFNKLKLYPEEVIIPKCVKENIIVKLFPLHNKEELRRLEKEWYFNIINVQPLDQIREYFGETVAMYFAFLGFYTVALILPALLGVLASFLECDVTTQIAFCAMNLIWATLFLETWKRYAASLAYQWGSLSDMKFEPARAEYYGTLGVNPVTDRLEPTYSKKKRIMKFYFVSIPVLLLCLLVAVAVMLCYFKIQAAVDEYHFTENTYFSSILLHVPSSVYATIICIMNIGYRKLAKILNDWENHRLQSAYDNHLITKLVLFDFVNCFLSLFYVAFYLKDMTLLRSHLATLLIVSQLVNQVLESAFPYLMYKRRKTNVKKEASLNAHDSADTVDSIVDDNTRLQAEIESTKDEYMSTLDDYLEMFLQFGYVSLFSSVFPTAALWAFINNVIEIRTDAFSMVHVYQRPFAHPTAGIGAWQLAFECIGVMAVITNTALVILSPAVKYNMSIFGEVNTVLLFVLAEHVLLLLKLVLAYLIPDQPRWVRRSMDRIEYQSKQAWRKQRAEGAQTLLKEQQQKQSSPSSQT